jgi:RNA polymerase sigma factor (sigma-70 family)
MIDDAALLRRYAEERSQTAFSDLVRRRIDLVYGAALRRTGDPHRAEEVAQQVFTTLAQQARSLCRHPALSAWLHTATRNAALNLVISDQRRKQRETEAAALETTTDEPKWEMLRPILDAAIDELPEPDRVAIVLRYLEHRAFAEIGAVLRVSEDAARMRAERALEKLRGALGRRGITSTAAALGSMVSAQVIAASPAGLASAIAVECTAASAAGLGALSFVSLMSTKIIGTAMVAATLAFVAGLYFGHPHTVVPAPLATESDATQRANSALQSDNQRLNATLTSVTTELAQLKQTNAALAAQHAADEAAKHAARPSKDLTIGMARWEIQQATLNNLRQIDAARQQYVKEHQQTAPSLDVLVGRNPQAMIKRVQTVDGEDYANLSMNPADPLTVTTPNGITVTYDPSGATTTAIDYPPAVLRARQMADQIAPAVEDAIKAYRQANGGQRPANDKALLPYFSSPKEGADFVEFLDAKKAAGM